MATHTTLDHWLDRAARTRPQHPAVEEPGHGAITYGELARLSDGLRDRLHRLGVRRGDRVGMYLRKSIDAVAAIFGILKAGAAYVPVDPYAPTARNAFILHNCAVKTALVEGRFAPGLREAMAGIGAVPPCLVLEGVGGGLPLRRTLAQHEAQDPAPAVEAAAGAPDDLAYILYTSGSTGRPKGVMLSHRNATSFVDWASDTFAPRGVGAGAALFAHAMDWERICLFASHVGTMERLLEWSVAYARTRVQFGQPIGKFQAVAHRLADMKVQLEAARLLTYRAAWRLEREKTVAMDASIVKLFVSESLTKAALDTVQIHGGYGYMADYDVERALRDSVASTIYSGTSDVQRTIIARWLGL